MTSDHDDSALPACRPPAPVRGQFHDGLEAAEREQFTRSVPKGAGAKMRFLAAVGNPAVTHDVIKTLGHLRSVQPRAIFLSVASAVTAAQDYAREGEGLKEVLEIVDDYLVRHRSLLLSDPACMTGLRKVLEAFVYLGWEPAIQRAQELPELFR